VWRLSKACLNKALQILMRRDHSCAELNKKLQTRGFNRQEIQGTIDVCIDLGYLDDERFADAYLGQLQNRGYGINGIKHKLYSKGIPKDIISTCIASRCADNVELDICRQVLEKKLRGLAGNNSLRDLRSKLQRFLFGRGFSSHIIYQTMEDAMTQED
jgi:regulatory protein